MELLTLIVNNHQSSAEELMETMAQALRQLHTDHTGVEIAMREHALLTEIHVSSKRADFLPERDSEAVYQCLSDVLAEYILAKEEIRILRGIVGKQCEPRAADTAVIESYCMQVLNGNGGSSYPSEAARTRRKQKIAGLLLAYLSANKELDLSGFIRFRLKDYVDEIREIVDYAFDEYMMEQQYQEFISLLKYFVYIQEAKIPAVHLIHKGGSEFHIMNEHWEPIDVSDCDSALTLEMIDKDINFEDMIVSTLIAVSPAQIYIHTREAETPIVKTIMQIFENRASVCAYCRMCHSALGEVRHIDR